MAHALCSINEVFASLVKSQGYGGHDEALWDRSDLPLLSDLSESLIKIQLAALRSITVIWRVPKKLEKTADIERIGKLFVATFRPLLDCKSLKTLNVIHSYRSPPSYEDVSLEKHRDYDQDVDIDKVFGTVFNDFNVCSSVSHNATCDRSVSEGPTLTTLNLLANPWLATHPKTLSDYDEKEHAFIERLAFEATRIAMVSLFRVKIEEREFYGVQYHNINEAILHHLQMAHYVVDLTLRLVPPEKTLANFVTRAPAAVWHALRRLALFDTTLGANELIGMLGSNLVELSLSQVLVRPTAGPRRGVGPPSLFTRLVENRVAGRLTELVILNSYYTSYQILLPEASDAFWPTCGSLRRVAIEVLGAPGDSSSTTAIVALRQQSQASGGAIRTACTTMPTTVAWAKVSVLEFLAPDHEALKHALEARVPTVDFVVLRRYIQLFHD